jgi:hypothetical protein
MILIRVLLANLPAFAKLLFVLLILTATSEAESIDEGGDQPIEPPDRSRALKMTLNGEVEAIFGRYGNYDGQFQLGHDIAVGRDGAVYVVDAWGMRVQKFLAK